MPAEFFIERNDKSIEYASKNMQQRMDNFTDLTDYVVEIEETYANIPKGKDELRHMMAMAQCIANRPFDSIEEDVQATYGELIGLEFINYLETDNGEYYKTGFAQSYMDLQINIDMLTFDTVEAEADAAKSEEAWRNRISKSIQQDLLQPMSAHGLSTLYEKFGQRAVERLTPVEDHQQLAMMGFRMIVTEALKPSLNSLTDEPPQSVHSVTSKLAQQSIANANIHIPTVEETEAVFGDSEGIKPPEWKDISSIREIIYGEYDENTASNEDPEASSLSMLVSANGHAEDRLNKFISEYNLLRPDDFLNVNGEFFGISNEGREFYYDQFTEIIGVYDGIHIIQAPSNWDLDQVLDSEEPEEEVSKETKYTEETVAIRLKDPKFIVEDGTGDKKPQPNNDTEIYIPLHYNSVTFKRLKTDDLEPEV
jgi:hypothetical protein